MPLRNNKGAGLVLVIVIMSVLSILGLTFLSLGVAEARQITYQYKKKQAYYHAKTGVDIAFKALQLDTTNLKDIPYYFYGDIHSVTVVEGEYDSSHDSSEIVTIITSPESNKGLIVSTGNVDGVKETISFSFQYSSNGGSGNLETPPADALDAGPDGLGWYNSSGHINHDFQATTATVKFDSGETIELNRNTSNLKAPAMYFIDTPNSLYIQQNKELTLEVDLCVFSGNVLGDDKNHESMLTLKVLNSKLEGKDIGAPMVYQNVKYGIVYLGDDILVGNNKVPFLQAKTYYYFPSGANLLDEDIASKLIKINDINNVDFSKLGITLPPGGVTPGIYN